MECLAWPAAVVVIAVVFIFLFRGPIANLIARISKIEKGGITAAPQEVTKVDPASKALLDSRQLMEASFSEVVRQQEDLIKTQLGGIRFENNLEREALLVRALARAIVHTQFDRINTLIFGSQLDLLIAANASPSGIQEDPIKKRFQAAKESDPVFHQATQYQTFLGFLVSSGLLLRDGDVFKITVLGKEFMKFLVDGGFTYPRRG